MPTPPGQANEGRGSGRKVRWAWGALAVALAAAVAFNDIQQEEEAQSRLRSVGGRLKTLLRNQGDRSTTWPGKSIDGNGEGLEAAASTRRRHIDNYLNGTAMILSVHVTHHAGMSVCGQMHRLVRAPDFFCMGKGKNNNGLWPEEVDKGSPRNKSPTGRNGTREYVDFWHQYFDFMSWGPYSHFGNLHGVDWEYENLVSMIVMRDPIERFLAGGRCGGFQPRTGLDHHKRSIDPTNETQGAFWEYANAPCSDNYALGVLRDQGNGCEINGANTSLSCLESAKELLGRFTFILDQACLAESMVAFGKAMHLNITTKSFENPRLHKEHPPTTRERIGNDTLYEFLQARFRRDIELYEWSKRRSIVVCGNHSLTTSEEQSGDEHKVALEAAVQKPLTYDDKMIPEGSLSVRQRQIENYLKGSAMILSIHVTHHAGTSVCGQMHKLVRTPDFACVGKGKNKNGLWPDKVRRNSHRNEQPTDRDGTREYVDFWHPKYFDFFSWEYTSYGNLHGVDWEYENLVSMIVMRDPIERFLAGGRCGGFQTKLGKDPTNETQGVFWEYANAPCADNYALGVLRDNSNGCEINGANTSLSCLESAKELLGRFTFILDQACLAESMVAFGKALHLNITMKSFETSLHKKHPPTTRERIGNDTLYEFLQTRFRRDIELYEWSKRRSIVVCGNQSPITPEGKSSDGHKGALEGAEKSSHGDGGAAGLEPQPNQWWRWGKH